MLDAVGILIRFPAAIEGVLRCYLKQRGVIVQVNAAAFQESDLRMIGFPSFFSHIKRPDAVLILAGGLFLVDVDAPAQIDGISLDVAIP